MIKSELLNHGSALEHAPKVEPRVQKHIVIVTWAMSRGEPHLFFWRDHNSYDNDPYLTGDINSGSEITEVARAEVADSLVFEGIEEKITEGAIKGAVQSGTVVIPFIKSVEEGIEWENQRVPLVFVEVMPSVLQELTKRNAHLLLPAWVLRPNSKWNDSHERRIEKAFKKFAAQRKLH
ncbi:MAG: hypothetical protein A2958_01615 [Candidatus Levybacteria bacterium RIFCSPLOWO2_01_FULL_38_13]|nr:MAG: hypothetical protein A2629_01455 [Candidatus Levybacteria bacterium RIFCSPHIGHO2_01_FULL_41_15]OGH34644.1 MAG: hypothetical protein A2958_01615 [Candidatus Levybacteria bacterium RIFCSPLOWO2_01_FULL_38_13]